MHDAPLIRPVQRSDHGAIATLLVAAFAGDDEARLVEALRTDEDVVSELVAVLNGVPVGHVMLSTMRAPFRAAGLAPLAVRPDCQRRGIGSALMHAAIIAARAGGFEALVLLGDPAFYRRFGFSIAAAERYRSVYAGPHLQMLTLTDEPLPPNGTIEYAPAFARH